ncbi:probable palmitoyltransferase ZDHHC24 [Planococcus citri]|uniref:probable palmitoyltransferase ZDHHC24 n=1 Tax=Planococcus citri TaxID=170843 RepID=UPI0031F8F358
MKLRRNFLPSNVGDWSSFLFIVVIIPVFFWFELFIVLPDFYDYSSIWYWIHFVIGSFIMKNITSNLLAVMFIDTSIFSISIPMDKCINWQFCDTCQLPIPPRCWHCNICNRCILKRDHHCTFSGCCVGHFNHRFFIMFLSYFFVGCCYALYFNLFFILSRVDFDYHSIFQIVFPMMLILLGIDKALNHCLVIMLVLNIVGCTITGILLHFHLKLIYKGTVSYEYTKDNTRYDLGLKKNIIHSLGTRWYLTWLSPFVDSPLIFDGADWSVDVLKTKAT